MMGDFREPLPHLNYVILKKKNIGRFLRKSAHSVITLFFEEEKTFRFQHNFDQNFAYFCPYCV